MKLIKNKKVQELEKYIERVEKDCDIERIEKNKYKELCRDYSKVIDENINKTKKLKDQNKILRQRDKKLKKIELLFENKPVDLKQLTKIVLEED